MAQDHGGGMTVWGHSPLGEGMSFGWGSRVFFGPVQKFVFAAVLGVLAHALVIWAAADQLWVGVGLTANPAGAGWLVDAVPDGSDAAGKIKVGDVILAVEGEDGAIVVADPLLLSHDSIDIATPSQWSAYMRDSERLNAFLHQGSLAVLLGNGGRAAWQVSKFGYAELGFAVWSGLLMSFAVWLIAGFIWIFSERSPVSYYLLLLGLAFVCILCSPVVLSHSFLAVTDGWVRLNYFGSGLLGGALLSLLMVYPSALVKNKLHSLPVLLLSPLLLFLPYLAISPRLFMNIYSGGLLLSLAALVAWQWLQCRDRPVQRAMFRWFFGVILLSVLLAIALMQAGAGVVIAMIPFCLMFLGFVFGVRRYRLFDVERWWFALWVWLGGGMALVALDSLLVWGAGLGQSVSFALSLLLLGWVYFPLRQALWGRWVGASGQTVERYLPELIASIFSEDERQPLPQRWQAMMRRIFRPLALEQAQAGVAEARLAEDGNALLLPGVAGEPGLRLAYAHGGKRLFTREDARLAQSLVELGRRAVQLHAAREQGAAAERQRIVRDLHDDVGAELVSLMHCLQHTEHAARVAQVSRNLRGVVSGLSQRAVPLYEAAGEWRVEAEERCRLAGVELVWRMDEALEQTELTPRQSINLARILREAVTNVLRHARATSLEVALVAHAEMLEMRVGDNGIGFDGDRVQGNGCRNMRLRAQELGGGIAWQSAAGEGCSMKLEMPLRANNIKDAE